MWACTPSGLDKISLANEGYIIENLTRQNNIYQGINRVNIDNNRTAWALMSSGLIKITPESHQSSGYIPQLMFRQIRAGTDTINDAHNASFSYNQNNLSFHFSAPSFMDEKQILYSYQLQGSTTNAWTETSNNAMASFIDLRPGNYTLNIKAKFPAGRYPDQLLQYHFTISYPWWQTWWFRVLVSLLISGLVIFAFRFYYHRKLEKQQTILERQRAIEQERNRIAADMHDDLGAGLTKIKYITEHILEKNEAGETTQPELQKLRSFSSELVESMGEIIWAASEKNNLLSNTLYYLRSYAVSYCEENNMDCHFEIPVTFKDRIVTGNFRRNIFLLLKEGLHNIVKHAEAKTVTLKVTVTEKLQLFIKDDGKGFSETERLSRGNGVVNMKKRVIELNGNIRFENVNGTAITIDLPFAANQSTID
jgi:signal transduction histidine kinase